MMRRTVLRKGLALGATAGLGVGMSIGLAGCLGGGAREPQAWWELEDPGTPGQAEADAARARLSLVVEGVAAGSIYDGTALLFSRAPGMRSVYQFANWAERPASRLARLTQRRLQARGGFRDVSTADAGVAAPELLLTLLLEDLYHQLDSEPQQLRFAVSATLSDWRRRQEIAWQRFEASEPVLGASDAASAVAAADRAVGRTLDELVPWVETRAAGFSRPARRPGRSR